MSLRCCNCNGTNNIKKLALPKLPLNGENAKILICGYCASTRRKAVADNPSIAPCFQCGETTPHMIQDHMRPAQHKCFNCLYGARVEEPIARGGEARAAEPNVFDEDPEPENDGAEPQTAMFGAETQLHPRGGANPAAANGVQARRAKEQLKYAEIEQELERKLSDLVGMEEVKEQMRTLFKEQHDRDIKKRLKRPVLNKPCHFALLGNPGTGKTKVARIIAWLLHRTGLCQTNRFKEVSSGILLTAGFQGQTKDSVSAICDQAKDGVLFIDEAYTLTENKNNSYADEAIATLMPLLGDPGGGEPAPSFCLILAGYKDKMKSFFESNVGLDRRIVYKFDFKDYSCDDLVLILRKKLDERKERVEPEDYLDELAVQIGNKTTPGFRKDWNAGLVDKLLDFACEERSKMYSVQDKENNPDLLQIFVHETIEKALDRLHLLASTSNSRS